MYNDIVTTIGKGNGSFLVLLDMSAAFCTIDHDNLFYILEIIQDKAICYTPIGDILIFPIDLFIMLVHVYGMLYLTNLM